LSVRYRAQSRDAKPQGLQDCQMNRIGRRTILAMLLIVAVVIV
jgi:hypothetical protein